MKKFIQWLAKVFNANITTEKVVTKEVVKEVPVVKEVIKYLTNGTIKGDVNVDGNLVVNGKIEATGGITCYKKGGNYERK
ncbi:hypothetical protein JQM97_03395 [Prevotella hominis]|uniref:hypothetical protein n=1 Tax=Segatella hominis TaxID=2518605 RepID=UPI001F31B603|nr:hypothetical protein [Segatella hominis]MCF2590003.1 hypothetical protein [Segatella hominis]